MPSALHVTPEAADSGGIGKIQDGDIIRVDAVAGTLEAKVDPAEWAARQVEPVDLSASQTGCGRELFAAFRNVVSTADTGASIFMGLAA